MSYFAQPSIARKAKHSLPFTEQTGFYDIVDSPIGELLLLSDGEALLGCFMESRKYTQGHLAKWTRSPRNLSEARQQLKEFFAGKRSKFSLPVRMQGTPFQQKVWKALQNIPFGETRSYAELAKQIQNPKACRAVGAANGANPIAIIVPCHRVIGANGTLTGFGGGLDRKQFLLELEAGK